MARSTKTGGRGKSKKGRKIGRNKLKCESYRSRIGKPRGPGQPGNKAGKNKR
jgi:hypothetical protein